MKFSVLALDYDGTIARHGQADPEVVTAIREARARGITVVLVTGRILSDLRRVLTEEDLFDAIVAENGAVLAFPNGRTRVLGRPASRELLSAFCERHVGCAFGECIVEADADAAPKILEVIRKLQLPLML
ncbi:MAG: HAD hydrolase family protein, partial [Chthoniobacteraceae bacterium]